MKIGIDLDGVVFNSEAKWFVLAELYDHLELKRNSTIKKEEPRVQEKYNWSDKETKEYFKKYVNNDKFDLMPGSKEVIELLKKDGHKLIIITARGNTYSKDDKEIAEAKLKKENIKFDKYYWNQSSKLEICQKENIDIMIDDNYHICEVLKKSHIKTLYFHSLGRKHLKENKYLKEVYNWGEIYRYISELNNHNK